MSRHMPTVSAVARNTMRVAFEELERTITPADFRTANSISTIAAVRTAALDIEKQLAARQALRNMRRLQPLLDGLERYSKSVDVLCNGTPFLPWIWSPIVLVLKVAAEYVEAFEVIMKGYSGIADCLPRFEIHASSFQFTPEFQTTLANFYASVLRFHRNAYIFVRRSGWKLLFHTSWGRFQRKFDNLLEDLKRHANLIDLEANARNISANVSNIHEARQMRQELQEWKERSLEQIKRLDDEHSAKQYREVLSWLKIDDTEQVSIFESIVQQAKSPESSCGWIIQLPKVKEWLQKTPGTPLVWLQGNPGCGKSVLSTQLVTFLGSGRNSVVRHFCSSLVLPSTKYENVLKSLLLQIIQTNGDLTAHVYQQYVLCNKSPSAKCLEQLLHNVVESMANEPRDVQYLWMVIDGIDECEIERQSRLLSVLNQLATSGGREKGYVCKILVSSRSSPLIQKRLGKSMVSLNDETEHLETAIRQYTSRRLHQPDFEEILRQLYLGQEEVDDIAKSVTQKADGMFLYARMAIDYLTSCYFDDGDQLKEAVGHLPPTLSEFYQVILSKVLSFTRDARTVDRIVTVFGWIALSKRPLKKTELLSAFTFSLGDPKVDRLKPSYILDICSPLICERKDTTLTFIHVSVKEFLQTSPCGLTFQELDILCEHGIAAVTCLLSGLDVFRESYAEEQRGLRMIKGVHAFHVYATEYWADYLLTAAATPIDSPKSTTLFHLAVLLAQSVGATTPQIPHSASDRSEIDERLQYLRQHEDLYRCVRASLEARSQNHLENELLGTEGSKGSTKVSAQRSPQDAISLMLDSYQKTVEHLLQRDSYPGVSSGELNAFKSLFRTSAYTCRLHNCPHATIGFESAKRRLEHEKIHAGGFRCVHSGCQYPAFRTERSLKNHVNTVHTLTPVRKFIRPIRQTHENRKRIGTLRDNTGSVMGAEELRDSFKDSYGLEAFNYQLGKLEHQNRARLGLAEPEPVESNLNPDYSNSGVKQNYLPPIGEIHRSEESNEILHEWGAHVTQSEMGPAVGGRDMLDILLDQEHPPSYPTVLTPAPPEDGEIREDGPKLTQYTESTGSTSDGSQGVFSDWLQAPPSQSTRRGKFSLSQRTSRSRKVSRSPPSNLADARELSTTPPPSTNSKNLQIVIPPDSPQLSNKAAIFSPRPAPSNLTPNSPQRIGDRISKDRLLRDEQVAAPWPISDLNEYLNYGREILDHPLRTGLTPPRSMSTGPYNQVNADGINANNPDFRNTGDLFLRNGNNPLLNSDTPMDMYQDWNPS